MQQLIGLNWGSHSMVYSFAPRNILLC